MTKPKKKKKTAAQKRAEHKRRSEAQKLVWLKRRASVTLPAERRAEERLQDNARIVVGKKPRKRPDRRRKPARKRVAAETLEEKVARLEREVEYARTERIALEETAHFTHTRKPEYLREDWTLAVMPSRLRHRAETEKILAALKKAKRKGKETFDEMARQIADFYDVDIKEVYTLWESP